MPVFATDQIVSLALGVVLLGGATAAWTGRWRRWAGDELFRPYPITIAPPLGALLVTYGLLPVLPEVLSSLLCVGSLLAALVGFGVGAVDPRWFGPRWYREREPTPDPRSGNNRWMAGFVRLAPDRESMVAARAARPSPPLTDRLVRLVEDDAVVDGHLYLYPGELVFAADRAEDVLRSRPDVRARPSAGLRVRTDRSARRPVLVLEGADTPPWRVRPARRRRLLADLHRHYDLPTDHPEALP